MKYEITITGASRPDLYKIMWESFNEKVKMREKPKITAYEDVIIGSESKKVENYLKGKVNEFIKFDPNRRLGFVMDRLLKNVKTEYFIYLQDDWKFLKDIDIDLLIEIMDENPNIKQIWFPKLLEAHTFNTFCKDKVEIKGVTLTPYVSWAFLPNITRTSFIRDIYDVSNEPRPESPFKKTLKRKKMIPYNDTEQIDKFNNCISYILGERGKTKYLEHLGGGDRATKKMIGGRR
jgi:hypothetical protein